MTKDSHELQTIDYLLKPGYIYLPEKPTSISVVLGSSVSVSLFDKKLHFGGAFNPEYSSENIGVDNHVTAREILKSKKNHISSEDIGGELGRKVVFKSYNSEIAILKVGKLRESDWHPYIDTR